MHDILSLRGGNTLSGTLRVQGAKNAALKIMAASILSDDECRVPFLPAIADVHVLKELLISLGVAVRTEGDETIFAARTLKHSRLDPALAGKLRASVVLSGPLLTRTGEVFLPNPGGCNIGQRPIDLFVDGLRDLGATVEEESDGYRLTAPHGLRGAPIVLHTVSVTATETLMMAAVLAQGTTIIKNAAMEPEIVALADYLNTQGARITGAGTSTMTIEGVTRITGGTFMLPPDRIEAGTFVMLGLLTKSELSVTNVEPTHLESLWAQLKRIGAKIEIDGTTVTTKPGPALRALNLTTHEYPGFVTDLQAPYTVLMTQAEGVSLVHETIFSGRLFYTDLLRQMGANIIMCDPHRVVVSGPTPLHGRYLASPDLRAGIALILAGLVATDETTIDNVYLIDRGYERIVERLSAVGAAITRKQI